MTHTEQLRAALQNIVAWDDGDIDSTYEQAIEHCRAALAAAPTEQDRRAGYIEGLEAAAKVCEASLLYGQDNAMKPNWNAALEWAAEDIRALIDKERA